MLSPVIVVSKSKSLIYFQNTKAKIMNNFAWIEQCLYVLSPPNSERKSSGNITEITPPHTIVDYHLPNHIHLHLVCSSHQLVCSLSHSHVSAKNQVQAEDSVNAQCYCVAIISVPIGPLQDNIYKRNPGLRH